MNERNTAASVRAKLLNWARAENRDFTLVLTRYALERLLYRLSISEYANHFLLKGALLFDLWFDVPSRPTRDIDLLGFGLAELPQLTSVFENLCALQVDDGIRFDAQTIRAAEIRKDANYAGIRVTLLGWVDGARCAVQVDVGYGDAVTPEPETVQYPVMLAQFPAPRLRVYPRYTVIAEKFQAMISLGMVNTRLKDYFDLWVLASHCEFDGEVLRQAIGATLARRGTPIPEGMPFALSDVFASDTQKQSQWHAFLAKNRLATVSLAEVVGSLRAFLMPTLLALSAGTSFSHSWHPEAGWANSN